MKETVPSTTTHLTEDPETAAAFVKRGEVVAFPTETVYGLGGAYNNPNAIASIFAAKSRPADNPLIVHIAALHQLDDLVKTIPPGANQLIEAFFPGPLTLIFQRNSTVPDLVTAGLDTVAIRMPAHRLARTFIDACDVPVAAPSANRSGRPSPTSWQDVYTDLKGRIPCILKGGLSDVGIESTVVDCTSSEPLVLRAGGITLEALQEIAPTTSLYKDKMTGPARSPGMKYRHYAPKAAVSLVEEPTYVPADQSIAYIGRTPHPFPEQLGLHLHCSDTAAYAYELFRFFRRSDRAGIQQVFCQTVTREGLGTALMDRLEKAAAR
ncbi:MAG: L-threonylcarbamoyladenylate synthase [Bacteroidota bacterium]